MLFGILVGLILEILGSKILHGYTYRLENIPVYVPLGHPVILAIVLHTQSQPFFQKNADKLVLLLYPMALLLCCYSLHALNDSAGMLLFLVFSLLLLGQKDKLTHLVSFFYCYYFEIGGTRLQAWAWYSEIGNHPDWPHVANPPSGIGACYQILHILTLLACYQFARTRYSAEPVTASAVPG